jgi:hypothetical protein
MILDAFNITREDCVDSAPGRRSVWQRIKDWLT